MTFAQSVILSPLTRLYQLLSLSLYLFSTLPHLVAAPISWWVWLMTAIMSQSVARLSSRKGREEDEGRQFKFISANATHTLETRRWRSLAEDGWMDGNIYETNRICKWFVEKRLWWGARAAQSQDEYLELTAIKVTWKVIEMCKKLYNQSLSDITWHPQLNYWARAALAAPASAAGCTHTTSKLGACHTPPPPSLTHNRPPTQHIVRCRQQIKRWQLFCSSLLLPFFAVCSTNPNPTKTQTKPVPNHTFPLPLTCPYSPAPTPTFVTFKCSEPFWGTSQQKNKKHFRSAADV